MTSDTVKKLLDRVQSLQASLRERDACIRELTDVNYRLQGRIEAIESSFVWNLYRRYARLESKLLPEGSVLRRIYLAMLEALWRRTVRGVLGPPRVFRELSGLFLFSSSRLHPVNLRAARLAPLNRPCLSRTNMGFRVSEKRRR